MARFTLSLILALVSSITAQNLSGTVPIPSFALPTLLPIPSSTDPSDIEIIRNTLAHYPLAIDGKNFAALSLVFAPNAVANYSTPLNILTPLSVIETGLESSLAPVTTQHSFGTQVIDLLSETKAFSLTYYTATHFGKGVFEGEILVAYGQYQDLWERIDIGWRIIHRNLVFMVSLYFLPNSLNEY
jgi:hypothetical protein